MTMTSKLQRCRRPLVAMLGLAAIGLAGCNGSDKQSQGGGAPGQAGGQTAEVGVITLHPQAVTITSTAPGRTVASGYAEIRPQVDGLIQKVAFQSTPTSGSRSIVSHVKAGDLLYQIDPSSYQAALDSANAALARANAAVPNAQAKVERYESLVGANTITQQNLDDARSALLQAKADVAASQASLQTAQINLNFTRVTAPIGGQISLSAVTEGALVTAKQTTPLATISQVDPIYVDLTDSSTNMLRLRSMFSSGRIETTGQAPDVRLTLEDGSAYEPVGKLQSADVAVSETTGTISLRVVIANPKRLLLPGMYVQATISVGTDKAGYLLPQRAVARNPKGIATAMFVSANGVVETRSLTTQQSVGSNWLVDGGIADGDRLIVDGLQNVRDGQTVKPTEVKLDDAGVVSSQSSTPPGTASPAKG